MSVWKRLQRVGKRASKFQFTASYQELVVECSKKWQPNKLCVVWTRRSRRRSTECHQWEPSIQNPYRGMVVWTVPENIEITVTLFHDQRHAEYEDKEWTFVIEDQDKRGRRKVLASRNINMKDYATAIPSQVDVKFKLKPTTKKVVAAALHLTLSCVFLREGKATDEDMQSIASLMSIGRSNDIGNLDDIDDDEEEMPSDPNTSSKISEMTAQLDLLHQSLDDDNGNLFGESVFEKDHSLLFDKCKSKSATLPANSTKKSPPQVSTNPFEEQEIDEKNPFYNDLNNTNSSSNQMVNSNTNPFEEEDEGTKDSSSLSPDRHSSTPSSHSLSTPSSTLDRKRPRSSTERPIYQGTPPATPPEERRAVPVRPITPPLSPPPPPLALSPPVPTVTPKQKGLYSEPKKKKVPTATLR